MTNGDMLPPGWCWAAVNDVAESMKNGIYKEREFYAESGTPCLRMYNIDQGRLVLHDLKYLRLGDEEIREYALRPGDIVVNRVNSRELVGKSCAIPEGVGVLVFESKNIRLRTDALAINPRYLNFRLLEKGRAYFDGNAQQTVGMASISQEQLGRFPIPLAPRAEQDRIVEKVEELLSDLDAGVAALERARANLKKYRAAVLRAAVTGELTAEWRAAHPNVEPAAKLLDRILAERRRKWEAEQEARFAETGKAPPKNWRERCPDPAWPDKSSLPPLPQSWCWATIDMLISESPQNGAYYPRQAYGAGTPIIRIADYQDFHSRSSSDLQLVNCPNADATRYGVGVGDLLINRVNSPTNLGKCLLIEAKHTPAIFESNMMRFRLVDGVEGGYVRDYLRSSQGKHRLRKNAKWAVNQASINQQDVLSTAVPLPPLCEQSVIVAEVSERLSAMAAAEDYTDTNLKRAARLRQSILKEAFAGRLVPQDPADEPASALLERIRQTRAAADNGNRRPKGRTSVRSGRPRQQEQ